MRQLTLIGVLTLVACGGRSLPGDSGGWRSDGGTSCNCTGSTMTGTFDGKDLRLSHVYYGLTVTWGSHAHPANPEEAVGLELLLAAESIDCSPKGSKQTFGLTLRPQLEIGRIQQAIGSGWRVTSGSYVQVEGDVCLRQIPVSEGDPVGYPPNVSGTVSGCATLTLKVKDKQMGQVSGGFSTTTHCAALDSAFGE